MSVENTGNRRPSEHLLHMLLYQDNNKPSGQYIEDMEAEGGRQLSASDLLPVKVREADAEYEALGFKFEPPLVDDPLFRRATLPEGWTRTQGEGPRVTYLVDSEGNRRVRIWYKAAFCDRDAFMGLH